MRNLLVPPVLPRVLSQQHPMPRHIQWRHHQPRARPSSLCEASPAAPVAFAVLAAAWDPSSLPSAASSSTSRPRATTQTPWTSPESRDGSPSRRRTRRNAPSDRRSRCLINLERSRLTPPANPGMGRVHERRGKVGRSNGRVRFEKKTNFPFERERRSDRTRKLNPENRSTNPGVGWGNVLGATRKKVARKDRFISGGRSRSVRRTTRTSAGVREGYGPSTCGVRRHHDGWTSSSPRRINASQSNKVRD